MIIRKNIFINKPRVCIDARKFQIIRKLQALGIVNRKIIAFHAAFGNYKSIFNFLLLVLHNEILFKFTQLLINILQKQRPMNLTQLHLKLMTFYIA